MGVLVDSNVILDVFSEDARWAKWSEQQLEVCAERSPLFINRIIYSEVSIRFNAIEELEEALTGLVEREPMPWEAAFLAGKAYVKYRRNGGKKLAPLPDFFIGAHASVSGYSLLTRDPKIYRHYFPALDIICPPETH